MLSEQSHLRLAGTAGTALDGQLAAQRLQPDVVIVDVSLTDALSFIGTLRAERPKCRILAFAIEEDIGTILQYAQAGADGFVSADCSVKELTEAINRIAAGELLCSPRIAADLLRSAAQHTKKHTKRDVLPPFTGREQQVFTLLKTGRSNKEIARSLRIAEATVKTHVHHVLQKLQVPTRGQAVAASLPALPEVNRGSFHAHKAD
jgi:DNA-binding NarL/FixJ family response regulator